MKIRMLPPTKTAYQTITSNGRTYTGQPGQAPDVVDFDARVGSERLDTSCAFCTNVSPPPQEVSGWHAGRASFSRCACSHGCSADCSSRRSRQHTRADSLPSSVITLGSPVRAPSAAQLIPLRRKATRLAGNSPYSARCVQYALSSVIRYAR
jgi:hypothetical protein